MNQSSTPSPPDSVLLVESFGRQTPPQEADHPINSNDEDLHSVFYARSMLMSWHALLGGQNRFMAWDMHEAEHAASADNPDGSLVGFAQVGLRPEPNEVVLRIPAVVHCLHDALDRFGRVEWSAVQIAATSLPTGAPDSLADLVSATNWFNNKGDAPAQTLITFGDQSLPEDRDPFAPLRHAASSRLFAFGALTAIPDDQRDGLLNAGPHPLTQRIADRVLPVTLPNWTPGSIGWALAAVMHITLAASPDLGEVLIGITRT